MVKLNFQNFVFLSNIKNVISNKGFQNMRYFQNVIFRPKIVIFLKIFVKYETKFH